MKVRLKDGGLDFEDPEDDMWRPIHLLYGKTYEVLGISSDWYRIIDEQKEPVLFHPDIFEVVDATEPADWISRVGTDGERYAYPSELNVGLLEGFFNGDETAIRTFWEYVKSKGICF